MTGAFAVRYTAAARDDLLRLFDFMLDSATTIEDYAAQQAIDAITREIEGRLTRAPLIYRKVGPSPFRRELVVPFRASGYVVLYEIDDAVTVTIVAVRHHLEDDYY